MGRGQWFVMSMMLPIAITPMAAQDRAGGQRAVAPAQAAPAMTLRIPGFPDGGTIPV